MTKEKIPFTEWWDCDDARLPLSKDISRTAPDLEFIGTMIEGQWQPIMVRHDSNLDQWYLSFGRKRLLACRAIKSVGSGPGRVWVRIEEGTAQDAAKDTLIENAQRSANEIGDYLAIKHILLTDAKATYKTIADSIGKLPGYVKHLDTVYARVPGWALDAVMDGTIANTVAVKVGTFAPSEQKKCKAILNDTKKLSMNTAMELRRFVQKEQVASMALALGLNVVSKSDRFFNVDDLQPILTMLEEKKYNEAYDTLSGMMFL